MLSCDFLIFDSFRWFRFTVLISLFSPAFARFFPLVMRSSGCFQWPSWDWYIRKYISPAKITPCKFNVGTENRPTPKRKGSKRIQNRFPFPSFFRGSFLAGKNFGGENYIEDIHFGRVSHWLFEQPLCIAWRRQCELREFLEKRVTWTGSWPSTAGLAYTWMLQESWKVFLVSCSYIISDESIDYITRDMDIRCRYM